MFKLTRIYNFLIDSAAFFIVVLIFSALLQNYIERESLKYFMILLYYLYYFIFELTTGQTIGKMITKTIIVNKENNERPKVKRILIRTLSRLIPIDFLSYLFLYNGFHDLLSKTKLKTKKSINV